MKARFGVAAALLLTACQTAPPAAQVVTRAAPQPLVVTPPPVIAAVRTPCVSRGLGPAPRYPDTDAALRDAAGATDRYQLMAAGRLMRLRRLEELERAVAACR